MSNFLHKIANLFLYCGLSKDDYDSIKKNAYVKNFEVWRGLHTLMALVGLAMIIWAMFVPSGVVNRASYIALAIYSVVAMVLFRFILKPDSLLGQLIIYLSSFIVLYIGMRLSFAEPAMMAVTYVVMVLMVPMFIIDKPYFVIIEILCADIIYIITIKGFKTGTALEGDVVNTILYSGMGMFIHVFYNRIRVNELLLRRKLQYQRDTDTLTGVLSRDALTDAVTQNMQAGKHGIMLLIDADKFKLINDKFGHDYGDKVLISIADAMRKCFRCADLKGRFGGDEFIVYLADTSSIEMAKKRAEQLVDEVRRSVVLPNGDHGSVSVGIASYANDNISYNALFKKADTALYRSKGEGLGLIRVFEEA